MGFFREGLLDSPEELGSPEKKVLSLNCMKVFCPNVAFSGHMTFYSPPLPLSFGPLLLPKKGDNNGRRVINDAISPVIFCYRSSCVKNRKNPSPPSPRSKMILKLCQELSFLFFAISLTISLLSVWLSTNLPNLSSIISLLYFSPIQYSLFRF